MILLATNHPCLRVGRHGWFQSYYWYNTSRTVLFLKTVVRIHLDAHIRTIIVLTGGKLIGIYFLYLLYVIYFSVTMHLRQGKNVSILSPGDANPGPVVSRRGLLEDSPYHVVGAAVYHAMSHDRVPGASRDPGLSCGHFHKT
jgi:hypothetical protein